MKRTMSLILVLVLCMSLCACGTDEKYVPLLEHLESGDYEGVKNELTNLSPDFKAEQEQMAADAAVLAKYASLIDLLEAEDYEGALADLVERIPVPEEPSYTEIEITMDNWDEYFVMEQVEIWHTNSFGETDGLRLDVVMYIKPEYAERIADKENAKLDFDVTYDCVCQTVEIDYEAQTYTLTDYWSDRQSFQNVSSFKCAALANQRSVIGTFIGNMTINDIPALSFFENVTLNRIQGILCLYDE